MQLNFCCNLQWFRCCNGFILLTLSGLHHHNIYSYVVPVQTANTSLLLLVENFRSPFTHHCTVCILSPMQISSVEITFQGTLTNKVKIRKRHVIANSCFPPLLLHNRWWRLRIAWEPQRKFQSFSGLVVANFSSSRWSFRRSVASIFICFPWRY